MTPSSSAVLSDLSGETAAAALDANVVELWRLICVSLPDAQFHEDAEATWFITGSAVAPWLNQVLRVDFAPDAVDRGIDGLLAQFARRGVESMFWSVSSSSGPSHLGARLEARGLLRASSMPGMALDLDALADGVDVPAGVAIERVRDAAGLERWVRAYIDGFEMEEAAGRILHDAYAQQSLADDAPLRHYVGLIDGRAIASATFFLSAGVAGVWHIGTLASERRRGIGAAMTLAGLRDARTLGYRVATLYASELGLGVYRRLGFRECNEMVQYSTGHDS